MSYTIKQKRGNNTYLYEATNQWCPIKKQARQKRKYLGKMNEATKEAIPPNRLLAVSSAIDYGHRYLLSEIATRIGLKDSLQKTFDTDWVELLLNLSYFQVLENKPFYLYETWSECCGSSCKLSSQQISDKLTELGESEAIRTTFFDKWISRQESIDGAWFDITSLSSYGHNNPMFEWGYNRDGECLPQINLGVLMGGNQHLPLFYEVYPGSITDVSTIKNIMLKAKNMGCKIKTWIMDRGFCSAHNIDNMHTHKQQFIIPLPMHFKEARAIIAKCNGIQNIKNAFYLYKETIFGQKIKSNLGKTNITAYVYLSEQRRAREMNNLMRLLEDIENKARDQKFETLEEAKSWLIARRKGIEKVYDLSLNNDGTLQLKRLDNVLEDKVNYMGKMVLVTNVPNATTKEILELYKERDCIEKIYDSLKNGLNAYRIRNHTESTMRGKLFITFLSLILQTYITNITSKAKKNKTLELSVPELIIELRKIKLFHGAKSQKSFISEISKTQREIFKEFGIAPPTS